LKKFYLIIIFWTTFIRRFCRYMYTHVFTYTGTHARTHAYTHTKCVYMYMLSYFNGYIKYLENEAINNKTKVSNKSCMVWRRI